MPSARLDEVFERLTPAARAALGRAEGIRLASERDKVHMEILLLALYDADATIQQEFQRIGTDRHGLLRLIAEGKEGPLPDRYTPSTLDVLPALSSHAREAVLRADRIASQEADQSIGVPQLFRGLLSVRGCHVVQRLARLELKYTAGVEAPNEAPSAHLDQASSARSPGSIENELRREELEPHVAQALDVARGDAADPITASRALAGVLRTRASSEAFQRLRQLLSDLGAEIPDAPQPPAAPSVGFQISPGLAPAVAHARIAMGGTQKLWGRALITAIVFGPESLELDLLESLEPTWRAVLQDQWAKFLSRDTARAGAWADAISRIRGLGPAPTYLLTWNPSLFPFEDMDEHLAELEQKGSTRFGWSIGIRRQVSIGDRVFLMRQGEAQGLVGAGRIASEPMELPHFDPVEARAGNTYFGVQVQWDVLSRDPIVDLPTLEARLSNKRLWLSQAGGVQIAPHLAEELEALWRAAGGARRSVPMSGAAAPGRQPGGGIAEVNPDRVSSEATDHLGVENEAFAFARLAASSTTKLPLSVGVFGEWGSGKTFFMEKMRAHVARLEQSARNARSENKPTAYHTAIVQITFNAWHYMETNLWASLVDHIFRELDKWLRAETSAKPEEIEALYQRLSTSRMLRLEALEQLILARQRRKEAERQVQIARQELAQAESESNTISLAEFWKAVRKTFGKGRVLEEVEQTRLKEAASSLGFVEVMGSAKGLMSALQAARGQTERGRLLARSVLSRLSNGWWMLALLGPLIVIPIAAPPLIAWILEVLAGERDLTSRISASATAISTILAAATTWVGAAVATGKRALERLEQFQHELDAALKQREGREPEPVLQAEQVLAQRRTAVAMAETTLQAATRALAEARSDFGQTAAVRLNRFIRDKIVNGDYAKHLGIIASVRRDFEQLATIMSDVAREQTALAQYESDAAAYRAKIAALDLAQLTQDGLLTTEELKDLRADGPSLEEHKYFQRIILYIDDLDRCPPKTVVEVLQACHLLLSFPLFVVVVAVDARWVSRALLDHYKGLLTDLGGDGMLEPVVLVRRGSASPRDYLEKIFQIPYWVRHMHLKASQDYTKDLVAAVRPARQSGVVPVPIEAEDTSPKREGAVGTIDAPPPYTKDVGARDVVTTQTPPGTGTPPPPASSWQSPGTAAPPPVPPATVPPPPSERPVDPNPESLALSDYERDFLERMAPFAGESPRTIKRFVNVYRLLRTGISEQGLEFLVGERGESPIYQAIIAQLAIATGAPDLADDYFDSLGPEEREDELTPSGLGAALRREPAVRRSAEWARVASVLQILAAVSDSPEMVAAMRKWAVVVKRYSFSARPYL